MRSIAEVQGQLSTSLERGLALADVPRSILRFGSNRLTPLPREPLWKKFIAKFDEPIIKILLAAALLSLIVDLFKANAVLGAISLALVALAVTGLAIARQGRWVPTFMFASALLLFLVGLIAPPHHPLVEGLAVMIAVMLATGVAFASEYKSDREFEILNAQKESIRVKVIRDGDFLTVPLEDVVVGDVVELETGDEIPADGRLLHAKELHVDQSLMTGESEPVRKRAQPVDDAADGPEQSGCLYRGTQVADGAGAMCVTEVGDATYLGQIARRLADTSSPSPPAGERGRGEGGTSSTLFPPSPPRGEGSKTRAGEDTTVQRVTQKLTLSKELTPLQEKLANLAALISKVGYAFAGLIFVAQLVYGLVAGKVFWPTSGPQFLDVFGTLLGYVVNMVIVIVVAVPEGLPMSVTVSLALAMQKMTRANSLVRQLVACETIGSATVICSDKTGTLTQNRMRVERLSWDGRAFERGTMAWPPPNCQPWDRIILNSAVNSTARLEEKDGKIITAGNSTEGALLQLLREFGLDYVKLRLSFAPIVQVLFSSERKRMTTVIRHGNDLVALVKGAPELLLERCSHQQQSDGATVELTSAARDAIHQSLRDAAVQAMRTLAFGYRVLPPDFPADPDSLLERREELERDLTYVGFVAIRDPLRDDVKDALAQCRSAGIEVMMITGDNVQTARAIGHGIGLVDDPEAPINTDGAAILTSDRFNELTDKELKARLPGLRILARARPLDKLRMVKALQELGEVVAVTGDGTNDAPALKRADVGLAMGIAGTEVAKEASKIVLLDDSFATIVRAVHWGRSLYENIQRFLQFQLTINVSALLIFFLGVLIGVEAPFTVLQLLWINVIMDTLASIALCSEPPRQGVMKRPPRRRDENILTPVMMRTIFITAGFFTIVLLGLLLLMRGHPPDPNRSGGPGLFEAADADPDRMWSCEASGSRVALPEGDLRFDQDRNHWIVEGDSHDKQLAGRPVEVQFTLLQVTLFFSIYVFFQVWNQINCRSLTPRESGFHHIWQNPTFLVIACLVAVGQIVIVMVGGAVFNVESLSPPCWLAVIAFTSSVLIFGEAVRQVRLGIRRRGPS